MTPSVRPRPAVTFLGLLIPLCALTGPAFALDLLKDVSKAEAKELGITVRVTPREKDVRVQVDFKPTGPKKEFKYAYLEVTRGGKRLVLAYVMPWKPTRTRRTSNSTRTPRPYRKPRSRSPSGTIRSPARATCSG